ncbi:hypothetical protein MMC16_001282 [Acarospora aff. strigata]|nr:hypothetical protein [Acarospora aff. strigata]
MSAVPTVAASDRFQPTDTCPEADGKVKKVGTVDYKITCDKHNGVPILSTTTADNMAACAQICQRTSGCMLADYSITTKRCDLGAEWKAVPDRPVAGGVSLVPVVNPAIASAPDLKATDVCPAIDKTYKKLEGGKTFKMWCNTASKGANVKTSKQPNREACIKDCASASGTVAINYCTGGTYAQSCQCKSEKEATPSYNYEPQYWWAATLAS